MDPLQKDRDNGKKTHTPQVSSTAALRITSSCPLYAPCYAMHLMHDASPAGAIFTAKLYVQCALGWVPSGTLVIAWRGTANFRNVLTDIKFFSRKVITSPTCRQRGSYCSNN